MISEKSMKLLAHKQALCNMVRRIAIQAGEITLQYFDESGLDESLYENKPDGSPLTKADTEAEAYIVKELAGLLPDVPVIGEELTARGENGSVDGYEYFWLVDPLDGTKEFKRGSPDFTVNIALIHQNKPVMGVVYAPARGELYAGCGEGTAVRWLEETDNEKSIRVRKPPHEGLTVVSSRNHGDPVELERFLQDHKVSKRLTIGSSLKICMIAAGKADIYPRFGLTSEWDTAAADAVLQAAGGVIHDLDSKPLAYGRSKDSYVNPPFIARALELAI